MTAEADEEHLPDVKMHEDEVDIDVALVRRLLGGQFPQWANLPIRPVRPRGTDNALYRVGEDMVARLPRTERCSRTLEKERSWLPRLSPFLPVPVPTPLAEGVPAEGFPFVWSVYDWLTGENPTIESIIDPARFAIDLAHFIAALQRIDAIDGPPPGEHNFHRGAPLSALDDSTRASIASVGATIDERAATEAWTEALRAPKWDRPGVWIHGDLDARNILTTDGRLSAVIDFGSLGVGDPACDIMVVWKLLSKESREIFRSALAVDDATWARSRGWVLFQSLSALAYYTMDTNPTLVLEARRWLAVVLASKD